MEYKGNCSSLPEYFDDLKLYSKYLGTLGQMNIYPLDGGYRFETRKALCFKAGLLNSVMSTPQVFDRFLVAYSPTTKEAILNVHKSDYSVREEIYRVLNAVQSPSNDFYAKTKLVISYLGNPMTVEDLGDHVAMVVRRLYRMKKKDMRLAICTPANRLKYETERTVFPDPIFNVDKLSSIYSPYTLVSYSSMKCLRQISDSSFPPYRFRANLVLKGSEPFIEDDSISYLKIGENVFSNITPCTHTPYAFSRSIFCTNPELLEPYSTLKKYRTLRHLRPEYHQYDSPAFGINMSLVSKEHGPIQFGDAITAYYLQ